MGTGPVKTKPNPLGDHWCDLLDGVLGVTPQERQSVLNRGSEWLTPCLRTELPCLSELLRTLQAIQRKWITPPTWGDNHWEFQPLFFNPNLNDKKYSKKRGYLNSEDFGFKPDVFLLNLKLTNLCRKGDLETRVNILTKVFGPQISNWLGVKRLQNFVKKLPTKIPSKVPSIPTQSPPTQGWYWEELSDLFENTVKGGKNYREVLFQRRLLKIDISKEKSQFKADNLCTDEALLSRQSLHWMELGVGCLDTNIKLYHGKKKFGAEISHFSDKDRHCSYCLDTLGRRVDQTFLHGSLECPQVSKLYRGMAQIFGFHETLPTNPKDVFIWRKFFKGVNQKERNFGREAFFKIINMSTAHHINNQIKLGSYATITSTANYIQNQFKNILTNYPKSRFAHILSKQEILDGLKKSGFSPTVWSRVLLYETIDLFEVHVRKLKF